MLKFKSGKKFYREHVQIASITYSKELIEYMTFVKRNIAS